MLKRNDLNGCLKNYDILWVIHNHDPPEIEPVYISELTYGHIF